MTTQERTAQAERECRDQRAADLARLATLPDRHNRNRFEAMLNS